MRFILALFLLFATPAFAQSPAPYGIVNAFIRATPAKISAGYLEILNPTDEPDALIAVSAPWAARAELHTIETGADGVLAMKPVAEMALPANGTLILKNGGNHLMFFGVNKKLVEGTTQTIRLGFRSGRTQEVTVTVQPITYQPDAPHAH